MKPLRRRNGDQYLHREPLEYRNAVKRETHAYRVFIQSGIVCQELLRYLAGVFPSLVWSSFGSWLRAIRPGIPPSELVVANALRQCPPEWRQNPFLREIHRRKAGPKHLRDVPPGHIAKKTVPELGTLEHRRCKFKNPVIAWVSCPTCTIVLHRAAVLGGVALLHCRRDINITL